MRKIFKKLIAQVSHKASKIDKQRQVTKHLYMTEFFPFCCCNCVSNEVFNISPSSSTLNYFHVYTVLDFSFPRQFLQEEVFLKVFNDSFFFCPWYSLSNRSLYSHLITISGYFWNCLFNQQSLCFMYFTNLILLFTLLIFLQHLNLYNIFW